MASGSIYDIREEDISISKKTWDDSKVQRLFCKTIYVIQKMIDFHQPYLERGQMLFDAYDGKILTEEQRAVYTEVESKYVIEPPIMKSPIRSLLGHIIKARKSGEIITEDGDYDDPNDYENEVKTMNIVLKDLETKTKEQLKVRDAIHDSLVSCYPVSLIWEKRKPDYDNCLKYDLRKLPWNSCVYGPINLTQPDMSDVKEHVYYDLRSKADLIENFPEMKAQIDLHWSSKRIDDNLISSAMGWDINKDAKDMDYIRSIIDKASWNMDGNVGLVTVFQRLFPVRIMEEVFMNIGDESGETTMVLPDNWAEARKEKWAADNADKWAGPYEKEVVILWRTVVTGSGLVLCNKKHWYQEGGKLPITIYVPCLLNGRPSGPAVDMKDDALRNCVAQIEYLDDMRKNGMMMITREGAFANIDKIPEEACKSFGIGIVKEKFKGTVTDAFATIQRNAQTNWRDYGEYAKQNMYDNTRLNETMQGESAPRQAAIAKDNEIAQALITNALYLDNFNAQWENAQNRKLSMVPFIYDETMMEVSGYDEEAKEDKTATLNVPQYDMAGEQTSVLNDVTSRKYRWKVSAVDDSPTAKARMMQEAILVINSSFGPLMQGDPTGRFFTTFLSAMDNSFLNKAGKAMAKDAEAKEKSASESAQAESARADAETKAKADAEMLKAQKAGMTLNFTGEQLAQYPGLLDIYTALLQQNGAPAQPVPQMPDPMMQQQGAPPAQGMEQPQPAMPPEQGVPEMAMA